MARNHDSGRTRDNDDGLLINQTELTWRAVTGAVKHTFLGGTEIGRERLDRNNYTFAVARSANKFLIKAAVEAEFKVTVLDVRVISVRPKQKRRGRRTMGTVPGWKKAVVTIAAGDKIELFEAV